MTESGEPDGEQLSATRKQSPLIFTGIVLGVLGVMGLAIFLLIHFDVTLNEPIGTAAPVAPQVSASTVAPPPPVPQIAATDVATKWTAVSKGDTILDGMLWVPEIELSARNDSGRDLDLRLSAEFVDEDGTVTSDDLELVSISAGSTRGPLFLRGSVGYKTDAVFDDMIGDESKKWRVIVYVEERYKDQKRKLLTEVVELPVEYREFESAFRARPSSPPASVVRESNAEPVERSEPATLIRCKVADVDQVVGGSLIYRVRAEGCDDPSCELYLMTSATDQTAVERARDDGIELAVTLQPCGPEYPVGDSGEVIPCADPRDSARTLRVVKSAATYRP